MLMYITWNDVTQRSTDLTELKAFIAPMRTEALLAATSIISIIQQNTPWDPALFRAQQRNLARQICSSDIADQIEQLILSGKRDVLTAGEQLLQAAKLAILYGESGPAENMSIDAQNDLGRFFLEVNELTAAHGEEGQPAAKERLITISLRDLSRKLYEQPRYLLARYYHLLVTLAQSKGNPAFDFDAVIRESTGLSIMEFMALAFLYYAPFGDVTEVRHLEAKGFWNRIQQVEGQIRKSEVRESIRRLFSNDLAGFRSMFEREITQKKKHPLDVSLLPFKKQPFYRTANGSAIPISFPFVLEKFSKGTYWALHARYSEIDKENGVNNFTRFVGDLFQEYLTSLLKRAYSGTHCGEQHFYNEQEIIASSPHAPEERPPFDGILISGNSIVLFEMTTIGLPVDLLERGDPGEFLKHLQRERGFIDKIKQLNRAIDGILDGTWSAPGLYRSKIRHIYPVLALLHPFPQNLATWEPLRNAAKRAGYYPVGGDAFVHDVQILTAEELEMLEPSLHDGGKSLPYVLNRKVGVYEAADRSMKDFLLSDLHYHEPRNEYLMAIFDEVYGLMRRALIDHIELAPE